MGIKTKLVYPSKTSELAKLFCTTYYGLCIAWHGEMAKICKKEFDFHPRITLARVKFVDDNARFMQHLKNIHVENRKIEVKGFWLVKSELTPEGSAYENLEMFINNLCYFLI